MNLLIFCDDIPGASVQAQRCLQLQKGLEAWGFQVCVSVPDFGEGVEHAWRLGNQSELVEKLKPDAVVFSSSWEHQLLENKPNIPLIVDLFGSRMLYPLREDHKPSAEQKLEVLANADCLLTASESQRKYFAGWLIQAGVVPTEREFIKVISPAIPRAEVEVEKLPGLHIVIEEGWSPLAALTVLEHFGHKASIDILGEPADLEPGSDQKIFGIEGSGKSAFELYRSICEYCENNGRASLHQIVSPEVIEELGAKADIAFVLSPSGDELEPSFLAQRFRSLGVPLVAPESHHLRSELRIELGGLNKALLKVADESSQLESDGLDLKASLKPLAEFIQQKKTVKTPVSVEVGSFHARQAYLSPGEEDAYVALVEEEQSFVLPAEDIAAVLVPIRTSGESSLKLELLAEDLVCSKNLSAGDLPTKGLVSLKLPLWAAPAGGKSLKLRLSASGGIEVLTLKDYSFPLIPDDVSGSQVNLGSPIIALQFLPGEASSIHRAKVLTRRALRMVQQGDWKRIYRAVAWRASQVFRRP